MVEGEARKSYPMLSPSHWWALRKKFRRSIPGVVTDGYLATVLDMAANSARANVLPFLKTLGLIDQDGKPTGRVKLWRDDDSYANVCQAMLKEIYPNELLEAITDPGSDRAKTERWFANKSGVGEGAAKRMAATYAVLIEADASKQSSVERKAAPQKKALQHVATAGKEVHGPKAGEEKGTGQRAKAMHTEKETPHKQPPLSNGPDVNINLQIHISADASSDQIDQIFASMARHLYKNG
jgi:hypothetical protein